jgi:hypothetical protein
VYFNESRRFPKIVERPSLCCSYLITMYNTVLCVCRSTDAIGSKRVTRRESTETTRLLVYFLRLGNFSARKRFARIRITLQMRSNISRVTVYWMPANRFVILISEQIAFTTCGFGPRDFCLRFTYAQRVLFTRLWDVTISVRRSC